MDSGTEYPPPYQWRGGSYQANVKGRQRQVQFRPHGASGTALGRKSWADKPEAAFTSPSKIFLPEKWEDLIFSLLFSFFIIYLNFLCIGLKFPWNQSYRQL